MGDERIASDDAEQTPCKVCGEPIRFDQARAYYKTADERFWHPDCLPAVHRSVDTGGGQS